MYIQALLWYTDELKHVQMDKMLYSTAGRFMLLSYLSDQLYGY